jgi:hypothetical protein
MLITSTISLISSEAIRASEALTEVVLFLSMVAFLLKDSDVMESLFFKNQGSPPTAAEKRGVPPCRSGPKNADKRSSKRKQRATAFLAPVE